MTLKGYTPTPPADVSCDSDGDTVTLHFERRLSHPPEAVWRALTEAKQVRKWAPYSPGHDLDSEGPARLTMNDGSEPPTYDISVRRVIPGRLLEHTWGESLLVWEVEPMEQADGTGSKVILHHSVPKPEWVVPSAAGWHMCLDLVELMLNGEVWGDLAPIAGAAAMEYGWEKLAQHYRAVLGDEYDAAPPAEFRDNGNE